MKPDRILFIFLFASLSFSILETSLAISGIGFRYVGSSNSPNPFGLLWIDSVPLSISSWFVFIIVASAIWWRRASSFPWRGTGLDRSMYDLMVKMRGGVSRLNLLRTLNVPRHRTELSELTGMDWKEVDRQIGLLEKYGLVSVHSESGSVKMYKSTEQGKLLIQLVDELKQDK